MEQSRNPIGSPPGGYRSHGNSLVSKEWREYRNINGMTGEHPTARRRRESRYHEGGENDLSDRTKEKEIAILLLSDCRSASDPGECKKKARMQLRCSQMVQPYCKRSFLRSTRRRQYICFDSVLGAISIFKIRSVSKSLRK